MYYNPLVPESVLQTEAELRQIVQDEGPFDGILGYSGGAALAAQLIIKDCQENPLALPHERPFRFAVFINGASPLHVFPMSDVDGPIREDDGLTNVLAKEAADMFLRPSALRHKPGIAEEDQPDAQGMVDALHALQGVMLADGTPAMTDGVHGLTRYNAVQDDILIDVPTLHIRCPNEEDRHNGLHLFDMSDPSTALEFHHTYGHDFPRGRVEMKRIAELIRQTADSA